MDLASRTGELAALATAVCWAASALWFEVAGRRIGSLAVNLIRLGPALVFLVAWGWITRGKPWPSDASAEAWFYLGVSGWVGFVIGDVCLFRAFLVLGTRLSTLVMALWPALAAIMSWFVFGEALAGWDVLGMTLTIGGIAMAVTDRTPPTDDQGEHNLRRGLGLALIGALGQAGGLVLSKLGMGEYDAFAATQIRIIAAIVGFVVLFSVIGWWRKTLDGLKDARGLIYTGLGAVFGPFLGVSLSLYAVKHTEMGVGASIMATTPVIIIPMVVLLRHERVGALSVLGTLIAVGGVAVLFML